MNLLSRFRITLFLTLFSLFTTERCFIRCRACFQLLCGKVYFQRSVKCCSSEISVRFSVTVVWNYTLHSAISISIIKGCIQSGCF